MRELLKKNPPLIAGLLTGLLMLLLAASFSFQRYLLFESEQARLTEQQAQNIKDRILDVNSQSYAATKTLSLFITKYNGENNFDSIASQLISTYDYIDAVELVKGGVIAKIYPLEGNESAIGYNIIEDPLRNKEALEAIERNELFFAGPIQLRQGYPAIVGRLPIFNGDKFWGFSVVLIRLSTFLTAAGLDSNSSDFSYQFSKIDPNTGQEVFYLPYSKHLNKKGTIVKVNIESGNWMIYVKRKNKLTIKWMAPIVIMGLLLTLISSSFVYYIVKQPYLLRRLVDQKIYEVRESEQKFRALVENVQTGVFIEQNNKIVYLNPGFNKIFGYTNQEVIDQLSFADLLHETSEKDPWQNFIMAALGKPVLLKASKATTEPVYVELILSEIMYNQQPAFMGTVLDVSFRVKEDARINKAVMNAQENERQQIGMELHDNVLQIIAASLINIDYLQFRNKENTEITSAISEIKKHLNETVDELRRLSHQLTPTISAKQSLSDKIESLIYTIKKTGYIDVAVHIHDFDPPLSDDIQTGIYRIIQEQLNNIYKHARASAISIDIQKENNNVVLKVTDNGIGFRVETAKNGIGLENIKRRASVLGGEAVIQSSPGMGCKVLVKIPLS
ncbi:PAS domain S-box protein [Lacibacter sp. MH-610]|uniref:PAS domain S-box protein n=1 Tax=Lacibacter sp. MH-610 TaxID=3020883 RepID=UPI0038916DE5